MFSSEKKRSLTPPSPVEGGHGAHGPLVKFGGLNGNALMYTIVGIATCGFSLFGYDQGESSDTFPRQRADSRSHVRHHRL